VNVDMRKSIRFEEPELATEDDRAKGL
jgi:hypothetical protein